VPLMLLVVGCGTGSPTDGNPRAPAGASAPVGSMVLSGVVRLEPSTGGPAFAMASSEVKATIDRNHDGTISIEETWFTATDDDGAYRLDVPVNPGETMVVRFARQGMVPILRTVKAAPKGNLVLNATLRPTEPLHCAGATCTLDSGTVVVTGLPAGTTGRARAFNPVTETDAFPGAFDESTGKLLVSGVFASFDLTDAAGKAVEKLDSPAKLRLRVPRATWGSIRDVVAANAQIDVPLYAFDEVKGTWVRDGTAHLEDGNGNVIAPSFLPTIRAGAFTGGVYAVGNVSRFSTLNVD